MFVGCLVEMAGQTDFPFSSFSGIGQSGTAPHLEQAVVEINTETGRGSSGLVVQDVTGSTLPGTTPRA
jgi:hypothetical protein